MPSDTKRISWGERIELNCKKCGSPVDLELNGKGTAYNTVGMEARA